MRVLLFFLAVSTVLIGWRYLPAALRAKVGGHVRANLPLVAVAAAITLALLAFALLTQGKIL